MSTYELDYSFSEGYQRTLNRISNSLRKEAMEIANIHIYSQEVRLKFLMDIEQFIKKNEWEVKNYCLSLSTGLDNIEDMREQLAEQHNAIQLNKIKQYAYIKLLIIKITTQKLFF